jgi:CubicO group peptidase (beta-lactamase class C family)
MSDNQKKFDELKKLIDEWREELKVVGTVVGVSFGDEEFTHGSGVTSADNPLDMTDDTLCQIGSTTKTFTATAMMRLVEDGKLDLNAPIQKYLPDFRVKDEAVSKSVTVKHLITHSAGWSGDVFTDTGNSDDSLAKYVEQMAELPQLVPPDKVFSYNNSAFCTAGRIIEVVTGKVYESAMQELIFEPLGLERAFFFANDLLTYRFVVGHRTDEEKGSVVMRPWAIPRSSNPAGAIVCHIKDLLKYGRFHMGDGSPILTKDTLALMQSPQFPINDATGSMGLSWFIRDIAGTKTIQHGGNTIGQAAQLLLVPEHNFAFGMLTNADRGNALITKVEEWALKEFLGLEDTKPEHYEVPVEQLEPYAGKYSREMIDTELKIEDGKLIFHMEYTGGIPGAEPPPPPPPMPLAMCGDDEMIITEGPLKDARAEFIRDDAGEIAYVRIGLRINPRVK